MRMFNNLEDCYNYSSDNIAPVVKEFIAVLSTNDKDEKEAAAEAIYATCQFLLMEEATQEQRAELASSGWWDSYISNGYFEYSLKTPLSQKEQNVFNSMMHILHTEDKSLRERGTATYIEMRSSIGLPSVSFTVYFKCADWGLIGGAGVPAVLEGTIRDAVSDLEVSLDINVHWINSHSTCGLDYNYSIPEDIVVRVIAADTAIGNLAKSRLDKLTLPKKADVSD